MKWNRLRATVVPVALALALAGCQTANDEFDISRTTVPETEPLAPPDWTYVDHQYITDGSIRFRLSGGHLSFQQVTASAADGQDARWVGAWVPLEDLLTDTEAFTKSHGDIDSLTKLYMGQLSEDSQNLWLAFGMPQYVEGYGYGIVHLLYFTEDGGRTWIDASPSVVTNNNMGHRQLLATADMNQNGTACMVMDTGYLMVETEAWYTNDFGNTWAEIPFDIGYRGLCNRVTTCRVLDDGTVQIDGIWMTNSYQDVGGVYTYEKAPDADAFVLITELPPLETAAGK